MNQSVKEIPLTRGKVAIVDDMDFDALSKHKWTAYCNQGHWYAQRVVRGKGVSMHRLILRAPPSVHVDHWDGDGLHNWRKNLRVCTRSQNQSNRGKTKANKSGFKGVCLLKSGKWQAQIKCDGEITYLGVYSSPKEAAKAYDTAALQLHGEFAKTNEALGLR